MYGGSGERKRKRKVKGNRKRKKNQATKRIYVRILGALLLTAGLLHTAGCGLGRDTEALENEVAYRKLGIEKMEEGAYGEAVQMFQNALDQSFAVIDDLEIDICYYKAAAQYRAGDTQGALDTYTALMEYDEKNGMACYLRGTMYLMINEPEKALADYQEALEREKGNGALCNKIGENLLNTGHTEKAGTILNQALENEEETAEAFREKGYSYFLLGRYDDARTYLDKAAGMEDTEAIFYLAKLMEAQGNVEQATLLYESYIGENDGDPELLNTMGLNRMGEGNYEQALTFFRKALEQEAPANLQELRRNEIAALEYLYDFAQAREKMGAYLADYPEDTAAVREYEFLKSR